MTIRTRPWLSITAALLLSTGAVAACSDNDQRAAEADAEAAADATGDAAAETGSELREEAAQVGAAIQAGVREVAQEIDDGTDHLAAEAEQQEARTDAEAAAEGD